MIDKDKKALEALLTLAFMTEPKDIMNDPVDLPEDLQKAVRDWNIDIDELLKRGTND